MPRQRTTNSPQRRFQQVYETYNVFKDFFGESQVDLQGLEAESPFILVWWPQVKVTNEHDKSIWIQDLYAKIDLTVNGLMPTIKPGFTLNRATYPLEQWASGYMHSHISTIPKGDLTSFQIPCLGTGPIRQTIMSLKEDTNQGYDTMLWMLFCQELSQYVTVESLKGVPYNRLEEVSLRATIRYYNGFDDRSDRYILNKYIEVMGENLFLPDFIKYYLHHGHLSINYQNNNYVCGMSYFDYIIDISNCFIEYFNANIADRTILPKCFGRHYNMESNILNKVVTAGGKFYDPERQDTLPDVSSYQGKKVCDFKGQEITLTIQDSKQDVVPQETILLNHGLSMLILNNILKIINYHYRNEYKRSREATSSSDSRTEAPAKTYQAVCYL